MAAPVHRRNNDGRWDSICLGCFLTIARAKTEAELREQELHHACIPIEFSQEPSPHGSGGLTTSRTLTPDETSAT